MTNYKGLIDCACDNIEKIFDRLEVDYTLTEKRIVGKCPVHDGDNSLAWNFYPHGHTVRGYWSCYTHHCEQKYGKDLFGCIKGILSQKTDKSYSRESIVKWLCGVLNYKLEQAAAVTNPREKLVAVFDELEDMEITQPTQIAEIDTAGWTKESIRKTLKIPAEYYVRRGYLPQTLIKYDIGYNEKYNRVMVPIFDAAYNNIQGFVGRSIYDKCPHCKLFHGGDCPKSDQEKLYAAKWRVNKGFYTSNHLYNLWFARPHIEKSGTVILVEGAGDVLKLEEAGIHNAVALFGVNLYPAQLKLLQNLKVNKIIGLLDNNAAGTYGNENIRKKLARIYYLHFPAIPTHRVDIGEMTKEEIRSLKLE